MKRVRIREMNQPRIVTCDLCAPGWKARAQRRRRMRGIPPA
jgi:hypothetical protein